MKVDIKFIARKAGVSPATVSRVMNGTKAVNPELKEKILQIVSEYNYRPNSMARALILKKSNLIGIMSPNVSSYFHAGLISAIEDAAEEKGYNVVISNVKGDFEGQLKSLHSLSEHRVDGLILLHENSEKEFSILQNNTWIPIVTASVNIPHCAIPAVGIDEESASYAAVKHLIGLGHKKIGGIFGFCHSLGGIRKNGYLKALREAGLTYNENYTAQAECTIEDGYSACARIFGKPNPPTALFCISDEIAVGCMSYLRSIKLRVPEDVSVIGFDDINLAAAVTPSLTTVRQPITEIGKKAAELLINIIENAPVDEKNVILPSELIIRESVAAPPLKA